MRFGAAAVLVGALAVPAAQRDSGFFPVAVDYPLDARTLSAEIARDLQAVRAAGFNTIKTTISWREGEPVRGEYRFDALLRTVQTAGQYSLRVILQLDGTEPAWAATRYPPRERKNEPSAVGLGPCLDRRLRADLSEFVTTVVKTTSRFQSVLAIDVSGPPFDGLCDLVQIVASTHQAARREVAVAGHARWPPPWLTRPADLPSVDDWTVAGAVDRYGTRLDGSPLSSERALAFDVIAGASRRIGWWLYSGDVPESDRRFNAWLAIARGAQGLIFDDPPRDTALVGTIARNQALFTQLRPRRAQVALLFDPSAPAGRADLAAAHQALYRRQITTDLHSVETLGGADLHGYRAIVATSTRALPNQAREAIALARAAGAVYVDASPPGDTVEAVVRAGLVPEVRIDGGTDVEVRFLESPTVQMIVGLNHASQSQRVTMVFAPETQEAIWLNLDTGTGVNFVAGPTGPIHQYWFRPKDVLVLMIRKDIR